MFFGGKKKFILLRKNFFSTDEEFVYDTREKAEKSYQSAIEMVKSLGIYTPMIYILYEEVDGTKKEIKRWERKILK